MPMAFCQQWEESEAGWGVRPDGYSIHKTLEDAKQYVADYLKRQQEYFESKGEFNTPHEYTRPAGEPYQCMLTDEMARELIGQTSLGRPYLVVNNNQYPPAVTGNPVWENVSPGVIGKK